MNKDVIILINKKVSERIYEQIVNVIGDRLCVMRHTTFNEFDGKELCAIYLSAEDSTVNDVGIWLRGSFSSTAYCFMPFVSDAKYDAEYISLLENLGK